MSYMPELLRKNTEKKNLQLPATVNTADMKKGCFGGLAERHSKEYSNYASISKYKPKKKERNQCQNMKIPRIKEGRGQTDCWEPMSIT